MTKKIAVVLFNLGGPDNLDSVQPFLFNLFFDKAIINLIKPLRWLVAQIISRRRKTTAQEIYKLIGGKSPILELTKAQANALEKELAKYCNGRVFVSMRHWHPMTEETVESVKVYDPDEIILLPLYPQFSKTTSGSSLKEWKRVCKNKGLEVVTKIICCYPENVGWIDAQVELIESTIKQITDIKTYRILFSAHGLPKKIIEEGDPYQSQVEETVSEVVAKLSRPELDWVICYQSRVGPLEWIGPSTEDELQKAGLDKKNVIVVPIAFVSDHSETLVELDIEYKELAASFGIDKFYRVPVTGTHPKFIEGLSKMIFNASEKTGKLFPEARKKSFFCGIDFKECQKFQ